jgi:hypothetical protein
MKASLPDIQKGIERVTESPTAKAAKKKDKMLAGITEAVNNGKWERGLQRVTLEEWKEKTISKGLGRIAAGVDAAGQKVEDFAAKLNTFQDSLKGTVDKMPDMTQEDRINKAVAWMRGMAKFKN